MELRRSVMNAASRSVGTLVLKNTSITAVFGMLGYAKIATVENRLVAIVTLTVNQKARMQVERMVFGFSAPRRRRIENLGHEAMQV